MHFATHLPVPHVGPQCRAEGGADIPVCPPRCPSVAETEQAMRLDRIGLPGFLRHAQKNKRENAGSSVKGTADQEAHPLHVQRLVTAQKPSPGPLNLRSLEHLPCACRRVSKGRRRCPELVDRFSQPGRKPKESREEIQMKRLTSFQLYSTFDWRPVGGAQPRTGLYPLESARRGSLPPWQRRFC